MEENSAVNETNADSKVWGEEEVEQKTSKVREGGLWGARRGNDGTAREGTR